MKAILFKLALTKQTEDLIQSTCEDMDLSFDQALRELVEDGTLDLNSMDLIDWSFDHGNF